MNKRNKLDKMNKEYIPELLLKLKLSNKEYTDLLDSTLIIIAINYLIEENNGSPNNQH